MHSSRSWKNAQRTKDCVDVGGEAEGLCSNYPEGHHKGLSGGLGLSLPWMMLSMEGSRFGWFPASALGPGRRCSSLCVSEEGLCLLEVNSRMGERFWGVLVGAGVGGVCLGIAGGVELQCLGSSSALALRVEGLFSSSALALRVEGLFCV